jgi:acyl-CoA hydrolase
VTEPVPGTVGASRASVVRPMVPNDANPTGNVRGSQVLAGDDRNASLGAYRPAGTTCVTGSFDRLDSRKPVHVGEVAVAVSSRPASGGPPRRAAPAFVSWAGIDRDGRPVAIPRSRSRPPRSVGGMRRCSVGPRSAGA